LWSFNVSFLGTPSSYQQKFTYVVIIDFESTCWNHGERTPSQRNEISKFSVPPVAVHWCGSYETVACNTPSHVMHLGTYIYIWILMVSYIYSWVSSSASQYQYRRYSLSVPSLCAALGTTNSQ